MTPRSLRCRSALPQPGRTRDPGGHGLRCGRRNGQQALYGSGRRTQVVGLTDHAMVGDRERSLHGPLIPMLPLAPQPRYELEPLNVPYSDKTNPHERYH